MLTTNRFARGSGVYACRVCKRNTRSTGRGDNEHVRLCAECFDLSGIENAVLDGDDVRKYADEIRSLYAAITQLGGNAKSFNDLLFQLGDYCPDCGSTNTESNGSTEYRCVECDHRWGVDCGEHYGY